VSELGIVFIAFADHLCSILSAVIQAPGTMRDSLAVCDDLFFAVSNANPYDITNATFDECVKLCITFEILLTFSALSLKNSAGLSLKLAVIGH
jgi:hypothetical protein